MSISHIARAIKPSPTLALNGKAALLREQGEPVIHLGGGEPNSKVPIDALIAAAAHLNTGEIRYAPVDGILPLKKAVIRYTEEHYHRRMAPENISGAKQAIMVALLAILNPNDQVIFPSPYWVSYPDMIRLCSAQPVPVVAEDGGFYPRIQDIEARVCSSTRLIIINSPNNPTGAFYSEQFVSQIVELCEKCNIYLIMDDIYHRLIFDGKRPISCYDYAKNFSDTSRLIVINGVSKQYAMTGFRIGWAIGNRELIKAMSNIQGQQTSGPSILLQHAAVGALNGVQSSVENMRLTLENNRNVMIDRLRTIKNVKVTKPDGTFYCFADFSAYEKDSHKLSERLIDKVLVVAVPGSEFGMDGHLRLSFCGDTKEITEGIDRIKWLLDNDSPDEFYLGDRKLVRDRL